jgi:2-(1,2-epoxy-1,2-dihydrophenyl)acetyl-CoA isomerase
MAEAASTVLVDIDGPIATVTMNRPERRNSIAGTMMAEMNRTLTLLASRDDVRVVVLRGAGRDFCPGADIDATANGSNTGNAREPLRFDTPVLLHNMPAVTIAAIDGACAGAGFGWACACDLRFATPTAKFTRRSWMSAWLETWAAHGRCHGSLVPPRRASFISCRASSMLRRRSRLAWCRT